MRKLLILALLCPFLSMCQPLSLTGKIINEQGEPVAGATLAVVSSVPNHPSQTTTATGAGAFILAQLRLGDTVRITAVGYLPEYIVFDNTYTLHPQVTVVLKRKTSVLDEVQVIAYGTTTRRLSTGSSSRVTAEQIGRQPVSNPILALEGLVPGLFIAQSSGLPGANLNIQLRGLNSLAQGTQPLFIVDGVPLMLNSATLGQLSTLNNNPFNTLAPADIESIDVLKDADATAIYGSQGANGVVIITTKKGLAGKTTVTLDGSMGWGTVTRTLPLLTTGQYLQMRREAFANDGIAPTLSAAPDLLAWDSTRYTNWKQLLIGGTARTAQIRATLTGGTAATQFLFSTAYYREQTVFPGNQPYRKATVRWQLTHSALENRFRLSFSASYSADWKSLPLNDLASLVYLPPNAPSPYDSLNNLQWTAGIENPFSYLRRRYEAGNRNLSSDFSLQYIILPGWVLRSSMGYSVLSIDEQTALPIQAQRPSATATGTAQWAAAAVRNWTIEPVMEYGRSLGKTKLTLLVGASLQQREQEGQSITGTRYANDDLLGVMAAAGQLSLSNYKSRYNYNAVFGRLSFNSGNRYLLNLNLRRDGSSRFGPANRFATFGSVGAAWVFTEAKALKNSRVLSWGKLRSSLGVTGNDQVGDYKYLDAWSTTTAYQYAGSPAGVLPARLFNPAYEWERVRKWELGLDLGFCSNRILLALNWFRNRSDNQLVSYKLPAQTGFGSILQNLDAGIQNTGFEAELKTTNLEKGTLKWSSALNISWISNKLLRYPGLEYSADKYNYQVGRPLRLLYTYRATGIDPQTGIYTFQDLDGNNTISSPADIMVIGAVEQPLFGGLTNQWSWKGLELSCLLQGVKQKARNYLTNLPSIPGTMSNQPAFVMERWQKPGDDALVQKFTQSTTSAAYKAFGLYRQSSASLEDASFIRLRNVQLSYNLPQAWRRKLHATMVKCYIEAQNLFTWTRYKGADPETTSSTALPPLRMLTAGIQLTF